VGSSYAVAVEKEDGNGQAAAWPPAIGHNAVPQTSGARGGGDSCNRVGVASRSGGAGVRWWR
jgi:hypothetical protein